MSQLLCEQCAAQFATVRVRQGHGPAQSFCEDCFHARMERPHGQVHLDVARFFFLLTRPRRRRLALKLPWMPAEATCPNCGLRYAAFAAQGLAGCGECYVAFADAIFPALEALHGTADEVIR